MVAYSFEGWNAHQSLGMLVTRRMEAAGLKPLGFVANDYALACYGLEPIPDPQSLLSADLLEDEFVEWVQGSNLLKRAFREVAVIGGLVERQHPGRRKTGRQVTFSTDLIYDVLRRYEPDHLLLRAAWDDAKTRLTDIRRLGVAARSRGAHHAPCRARPDQPMAVPVLIMIGREMAPAGTPRTNCWSRRRRSPRKRCGSNRATELIPASVGLVGLAAPSRLEAAGTREAGNDARIRARGRIRHRSVQRQSAWRGPRRPRPGHRDHARHHPLAEPVRDLLPAAADRHRCRLSRPHLHPRARAALRRPSDPGLRPCLARRRRNAEAERHRGPGMPGRPGPRPSQRRRPRLRRAAAGPRGSGRRGQGRRLAGVLNIDRGAIVEARWADNGPGWIGLRLGSSAEVLALEPARHLASGSTSASSARIRPARRSPTRSGSSSATITAPCSKIR